MQLQYTGVITDPNNGTIYPMLKKTDTLLLEEIGLLCRSGTFYWTRRISIKKGEQTSLLRLDFHRRRQGARSDGRVGLHANRVLRQGSEIRYGRQLVLVDALALPSRDRQARS